MGCICVECEHKCSEYNANYISDKSYYEWTLKEEKCVAEQTEDFRRRGLLPIENEVEPQESEDKE